MITNQPNFISYGSPNNPLIQAPTGFMRQPDTFPVSNDQDPLPEFPRSSSAEHQEKNREEQLLTAFMPISTSVNTPDSNYFSDGSGNYSNVGYSNDNANRLTGVVHHAPQLAQVPWVSIEKKQQSTTFYDNNSKNANHDHLQHPLIIMQNQERAAQTPSTHTVTSFSPSSASRWPSWSPVIDEPRDSAVSSHHLTAIISEGPEQAAIPKREEHQKEHQKEHAFQLFNSSADLQTATCSSNGDAALYDTRHRTNSLPGRIIPHSDQVTSFHPFIDDCNEGFNNYRMPSTQLTVASWLKPHLQSYLLATNPSAMGEKTIVVLTGKVAQKSYGTEKRFLCPPPTVILDGPSWWTHHSAGSKQHQHLTQKDEDIPPKVTVTISGESETQEGQVDWFSQSGAMVGQTGFTGLPHTNNGNGTGSLSSNSTKNNVFDKAINTADRDWVRVPAHGPLQGGKCQLRQLYINDTDEKRKRIECLVSISLSNGVTLGTVASHPIKVISKPSKKRLSMKNTDSWIHHGTTVSLFNRIRSQTVSTKYLAVSTVSPSTGLQEFMYPGQSKASKATSTVRREVGTCFTSRTGSWDPFVIWLVDMNWVPPTVSGVDSQRGDPDEYIGSCSATIRSGIPYPTPPVIAVKNKTSQPLAIHYNQHVVLQCLTTGLVSPVMIIRKIDRASTVVGGANARAYTYPEGVHGGEYGDEILGDPVSQLHRVALQVVKNPESNISTTNTSKHIQADLMPRANHPPSYLACLADTVAIHQSAHGRLPIESTDDGDTARVASRQRIKLAANNIPRSDYYFGVMNGSFTHHYSTKTIHGSSTLPSKRSRSSGGYAEDDSFALPLPGPVCWSELGAYWSEDVSDSAVWTIAGTDCVKYTLWDPPGAPVSASSDILKPEPMLPAVFGYSHCRLPDQKNRQTTKVHINVNGKNLSRDLEVWFGDVRSPQTEYHSAEQIVCEVPSQPEMAQATGASWTNKSFCSVPLLLVKRDGKGIYKTGKDYVFL